MKKILFPLLLATSSLLALPVNNPGDPRLFANHLCCERRPCAPCNPLAPCCDTYDILAMFRPRLGFEGNYVYNRHLKATNTRGDIERVTIMTNAGLIVFNFNEWLDFFGTVGVTNFHAWGDAFNSLSPTVSLELGFSPTFSFSGGARLTLWDCGCFCIGLEGEYFYTESQLNYFDQLSSGTLTYFDRPSQRGAGYGEWQAALGATYIFVDTANFALCPYTALQFSGVSWQLNQAGGSVLTLPAVEADKVVGWTLGMTGLFCEFIAVSVEARYANEKALSVISQLSF